MFVDFRDLGVGASIQSQRECGIICEQEERNIALLSGNTMGHILDLWQEKMPTSGAQGQVPAGKSKRPLPKMLAPRTRPASKQKEKHHQRHEGFRDECAHTEHQKPRKHEKSLNMDFDLEVKMKVKGSESHSVVSNSLRQSIQSMEFSRPES